MRDIKGLYGEVSWNRGCANPVRMVRRRRNEAGDGQILDRFGKTGEGIGEDAAQLRIFEDRIANKGQHPPPSVADQCRAR